MTKVVKAQIYWVPARSGGRKTPPSPPSYSTVAKFEDIQEKWPEEAWSVVLSFDEPPSITGYLLANLRFLAEDAPNELLYNGSKFELFEGDKKVASGTIIVNK